MIRSLLDKGLGALVLSLGVACTSQTYMETGTTGLSSYGDTYVIDIHTHILPTDKELNDQFIDDLVAEAQSAGVSEIGLGLHARQESDAPPTYSEDHDTMVLEAYEAYPDVIIPLLAGFDPADPDAVSYVEEQLKTGKWKGIGELDLRNQVKKTTTPMNDPTMMKIYRLAAGYDVPVLVHYDPCYETDCDSGKAEYEGALVENPDTIFITAHRCDEDLMKKYGNLYCEPENLDFPLPDASLLDRVMVGTDVQRADLKVQMGRYSYEEYILAVRENLGSLDSDVQENILHGTAKKCFILLK